MFPVSFLKLAVYVLSLFLVNLIRGLLIGDIAFELVLFSTDFLFSISLISALNLPIFLLLTLDLICCNFSSFLGWKLYSFSSFFFSNICMQCHKFPFKHCFCCITQILISCVSFDKKYFKISLEILSIHIISQIYYLISMYWGILHLSFCYLFAVDFIMV